MAGIESKHPNEAGAGMGLIRHGIFSGSRPRDTIFVWSTSFIIELRNAKSERIHQMSLTPKQLAVSHIAEGKLWQENGHAVAAQNQQV